MRTITRLGESKTDLMQQPTTEPHPPVASAAEPAAASQCERAPTMCEHCGGPARVYVLEGYADGRPKFRCVCLGCLETLGPVLASGPRRRPLRLRVLVLMVGVVLLAIGAFGDYLIPNTPVGFGWHKQIGVALAGALLLVGLLLGAEVIALGGGLFLAGCVFAGEFGLTKGAGVGWKQGFMIAAGGWLLLVGWLGPRLIQRVRHARAWASRAPEGRSATPGPRRTPHAGWAVAHQQA